MARLARSEVVARLQARKARNEPIVGSGAGTGISAKAEAAGGTDLIVIYNSGRYRMAGRGSLAGMMPFGDANGVVLEMAREVLPVVSDVPVLAGVCGTDPFRQMDVFLDEVARLGFSGVQNFPTVGLIDGRFRAGLEETGMGYGCEVEMIARAHARDLLTTPYVFEPAEAAAMARAGADILVCHFGLTVGGTIGASTSVGLDDCPTLLDAMAEAAFAVNRDVLILAHGGPIAEPADAQFVFANSRHCNGFYGASSMERLPVERAIREQVAQFKGMKKSSQ
jgi:predicted TIM-barrel enzyme